MEKYKVSVIIPVYNMELYIEDAVNSVLNQTLGRNNIQIILVNDGSTDNSELICKELENKNENILYLSKKNSGVSDTRNYAIKYIKGKYVNFLDSDDKWDDDALEKGYNMLESNDDIDFVSYRIKFFEGKTGYHHLDYKFDGDYVVNLNESIDKIQLSSASILFRSSLFEKYNYDSSLRIAEDYKLVSQIVLNKLKYGMISSSCYNYRIRGNNSSAMQSLGNKKEDYIVNVKNCHLVLIDECLKKYGLVPKYIQYTLVYEIQWRLNNSIQLLNDNEKQEYKKLLHKIIKYCDDDIIVLQQKDYIESMFYNLNFKYSKNILSDINVSDSFVCYNKTKLFDLSALKLNIYNLEIKNSKLIIDCIFNSFKNNCFDIYIVVDNKKHKMNINTTDIKVNNLFGETINYFDTFYSYELNDISSLSNISFAIDINGITYPMDLNFVRYAKLNKLKNSYYKKNGYVLTYKDNKILVNRKSNFNCIKYLSEILFKKKDLMLFGMLCLYYITYPFVKHDNWIVSDRFDVAGDNGEHLFKYIRNNRSKKNVYFALSKDSKDLDRMKKYGKVIKFNSLSFYLKYLNSEVVISSHMDDFINKPFRGRQIYLNYLLKRKYVFLQHGITKDNLSGWLSKYNNKIDLFICSAIKEYNSILLPDYMYDKNVVKLTGLPRYDNLLVNDEFLENIIALMPTWRTNLVGEVITGSQDRSYNSNFKDSEYFKFYNGIISNKKIQSILKKYDFEILFCLHPAMKGQYKDFEKNEFTDIIFYPNYQEVFKKSKFLITDYSSVFFDFSYLKKPILYTQFDVESLTENHGIYKERIFEYEEDGFGDVVYNLDDAVNKIISIIENGCKMEDKYKKRVDKFFKYKDDKNCERVYNEIIKMLDGDKCGK